MEAMWAKTARPERGGFLTPQPPAWKKPQSAIGNLPMPMSERKILSPSFHVIHKVPACDSPYGRAKHVQLIEKDPNKAISLFWAAINAGDRVDSALKDMAVVMKQLNRSDEAIEAIKSFRHLCPNESQESLDNVLVELYKRSGRVEEEIEILQNKLRNIEEGTVFGGKRTKIARSQGKKIQITIEQEKSRILGNLAWAYLQQHNYGIAEQHYRKALALEPDKNKECNLAICLMHMNRINEAKSLLQDVKASCGNEEMDESYSKSYDRALEMLIQVESRSLSEPVEKEPDKGKETRRSSTSCRDRSLKEASIFLPRNEDKFPGLPYAQCDRNHLPKYDERTYCTPIGGKGILQSTPQTTFTEKWRKSSCLESPSEGPMYPCKMEENWRFSTAHGVGSAHKKMHAYASSAASRKNSEALFTQPRRSLWGFNATDQRRGGRWGDEDRVRNSIRKLSFEQTLTSETMPIPSTKNLKEEALENPATGQEEEEVLFTQPRNSSLWLNNRDQRRGRWPEETFDSSFCKLSLEKTTTSSMGSQHSAQILNGEALVSSTDESGIELEKQPASITPSKKSWADMVEEEEEEEEEEFNDENLNCNIIYQHPESNYKEHVDNITHQLESFDMKAAAAKTVSSRRNRLQVFKDITNPP